MTANIAWYVRVCPVIKYAVGDGVEGMSYAPFAK
jgi:hypothetical protein